MLKKKIKRLYPKVGEVYTNRYNRDYVFQLLRNSQSRILIDTDRIRVGESEALFYYDRYPYYRNFKWSTVNQYVVFDLLKSLWILILAVGLFLTGIIVIIINIIHHYHHG